MGLDGQCHALAALPRERPGTHCTGGWVGPRCGMDGCGKSRSPTSIWSPDCPTIANHYTNWAILAPWNVIQNIKSIQMGWVEHVAHKGEWRSAYKVLVRKHEGKKTLVGRLKHRREDTEMELQETDSVRVGTKLIWLSTGSSNGIFRTR